MHKFHEETDLLMSIYDASYWETPNLPKGVEQDTPSPTKEIKCECGVEKTYGKDFPQEYHVDYCPLYKKEK